MSKLRKERIIEFTIKLPMDFPEDWDDEQLDLSRRSDERNIGLYLSRCMALYRNVLVTYDYFRYFLCKNKDESQKG